RPVDAAAVHHVDLVGPGQRRQAAPQVSGLVLDRDDDADGSPPATGRDGRWRRPARGGLTRRIGCHHRPRSSESRPGLANAPRAEQPGTPCTDAGSPPTDIRLSIYSINYHIILIIPVWNLESGPLSAARGPRPTGAPTRGWGGSGDDHLGGRPSA